VFNYSEEIRHGGFHIIQVISDDSDMQSQPNEIKDISSVGDEWFPNCYSRIPVPCHVYRRILGMIKTHKINPYSIYFIRKGVIPCFQEKPDEKGSNHQMQPPINSQSLHMMGGEEKRGGMWSAKRDKYRISLLHCTILEIWKDILYKWYLNHCMHTSVLTHALWM